MADESEWGTAGVPLAGAWSAVGYGYEWFRVENGRDVHWVVTWPLQKPLVVRERRVRHRIPDWVWAAWCARQLIEGTD